MKVCLAFSRDGSLPVYPKPTNQPKPQKSSWYKALVEL